MDAVLRILQLYKFDLGDRSLMQISSEWSNYNPNWLHSAITESLYRGRYKVISVEQILESWHRKQEVFSKFDDEFEQLVWGNLDQPDSTQKTFNNSVSGTSGDKTMIEKLKSLCQI